MSLIARNKGGSDFEPVGAGMHRAVCYGVVDLGTQTPPNPKFRPAQKVCILFEVPNERVSYEKDGRKLNVPKTISGIWTNSLHPKSNLRATLKSWRGRDFTDAELAGFDLTSIVGANCLLNVVHVAKEDRTYANIAGVNPLMKGDVKLPLETPKLVFDLDDYLAKKCDYPTNMPDWIKAKIMLSEEYIAATGPDSTVPMDEVSESDGGTSTPDEDVPF